MIKPLRKRHLQIWTALAALLPVGIILSWLVIPNPVPVKLLNPAATELLPVIKYKKDNDQYCINIRTNNDNSAWQLEWKNKMALTVPSAVIYKTSGNSAEIKNWELVGRIEARGNYVFSLPADPAIPGRLHLTLYDFIHQQIIDSINFQP